MATNGSQNIVTAATGKVLQGAGVGTAPAYSTATYPSTATGTGKILRADGTNWVATTATYPDTAGTNGNVLTSDGTNWTSAAPSGGGLTSLTFALTNAQIKALNATPVEVIAAPGAGNVIQLVFVTHTMNYGGTNVFIAGSGQTVSLYYGTTSASGIGVANAAITASTSRIGFAASSQVNGTYTNHANVAVNAYNPIATEITGNAANNNTITFVILYRIITIP